MGTNYYAVRVKPSVNDRAIHIGKASFGWLFCFHDCEHFHTYPQVKMWLHENVTLKKDYVLMDEYDRVVDVEDFIEMVKERQDDPKCRNNPDNFDYCRNIDGYRFSEGEFC